MFSLLLIGGVGVGLIAIKAIRGSREMVQADYLLAEYEPADAKADPAVGPTYRNVCALDGYPSTLEGAETLYELFTSSVERFADNACLGTRPKVNGEAGPYEFLSYAEVGQLVSQVGSALVAKGVQPQQKCSVYGANSPEWMVAMQACNRQSVYCVPLYDSLGEGAVEFILNHSESSIVFVSAEKLPTLLKALPAVHKGLQTLVYWGTCGIQHEGAQQAAQEAGIAVHSWEEFLELGRGAPAEACPPKPADLCTIMYTSGTTGDPKGVMLSHAAVIAEVAGLQAFLKQIPAGITIDEHDAMLSYLPLAHIFDRSSEEMFLSVGARIGYFQGDVRKLVDDIGALKPTLFIGVPRVFDRIYAAAMGKIEKGGLAARLFNWGYRTKAAKLAQNVQHDKATPLFDRFVFSKVAQRLGGRVRIIVSGGAPLAPHTEEFLKVTMCAPVVQGYGLTETCAGSFISVPGVHEMSGTVGPPLPCTSFRLMAVPEMNYSPDADPPRGEVAIAGPTLFAGYYKDEGKTAEALQDGWFATGDIGELTPAGALRIIDRRKNIFKLSQGEYVAVEKVEAVYKRSRVVEQIWVYGNSFEASLVAVVVPKEDALQAWAAANGVQGDFRALVGDARAAEHVLSELSKVGKEDKLKGFEQVRAVHLDTEQFSVEKDLLTPTFKLKRPQLLKHYQAQIDALYSKKKSNGA